MTTTDVDPPAAATDEDGPTRWVLASFSAGAGLVHAVMVPSHLATSAVEGAGFLVAAWLQLALAVALVARPTRRVLAAAVVVNAGLVALWSLSRTGGLPFGDHAHHAETVSFVDGTCVAFELLLVGLLALRLWRPGALRLRRGLASGMVPIVVFAVASAAIASPQARDHSTHAHGDHQGGGHEDAPAEPADTGGPGDPEDFAAPFGGHDHDDPPPVELDPATRARLTAQLILTARMVEEYPTIAAAEAKGANRTGPFLPGQGSHFMPPGFRGNPDGVMDPEDVLSPLLVFDGTGPDAPLAGFMYYYAGEAEPEGFVGPNDHWHRHTQVCTVFRPDGSIDTPFGAEDDRVTREMCDGVGGDLLQTTGWMVHVWAVPGYESEDGVFSSFNTKVTCPDGTFEQIPWFEVGDSDTFCRTPG
jgi:hypothetical protein